MTDGIKCFLKVDVCYGNGVTVRKSARPVVMTRKQISYSGSFWEEPAGPSVCLSSVVCLSVTFVHSTQPVQIFGVVAIRSTIWKTSRSIHHGQPKFHILDSTAVAMTGSNIVVPSSLVFDNRPLVHYLHNGFRDVNNALRPSQSSTWRDCSRRDRINYWRTVIACVLDHGSSRNFSTTYLHSRRGRPAPALPSSPACGRARGTSALVLGPKPWSP